jgi:hypothetical protein
MSTEGLISEPVIDFKSGYVLRAQDKMPKTSDSKTMAVVAKHYF